MEILIIFRIIKFYIKLLLLCSWLLALFQFLLHCRSSGEIWCRNYRQTLPYDYENVVKLFNNFWWFFSYTLQLNKMIRQPTVLSHCQSVINSIWYRKIPNSSFALGNYGLLREFDDAYNFHFKNEKMNDVGLSFPVAMTNPET
jgi:hypothetical protein